MLFGKKKLWDLEALLIRLENDYTNNYKDAAREDYEKLIERAALLKASGEMSGKTAEYYLGEIEKWKARAENL